MDKQALKNQFSEDMRKVMYTGVSGPVAGVGTRSTAGSGTRARSPGLAAGAALALGAAAPTAAAESRSDAREQCRQAVEYSRRSTCPFDDHSAFGANADDRAKQARLPVHDQDDVAQSVKDARNLGKYNRDIGHKTGAGSPFDAPFDDTYATSANCIGGSAPAGRRRCGQPLPMPQGGSPILAEAVSESRSEAAAHRNRNRGTSDLLGGYEFIPQRPVQEGRGRNNNLPPRPADQLMPEAFFKLQYDGGSVKGLTQSGAEYRNSKCLEEANKVRNAGSIQLG